jgi:hypothetical protein
MQEQALCTLLALGRLSHRDDLAAWAALRGASRALRGATEHPLFARLLPHQRLHFLRLDAALARHGAALDESVMGRGKSYTACALAAANAAAGGKTVIWGPPSSELNWRRALAHFGLGADVAEFYSYSRTQAKHPPYLDSRSGAVDAAWQRVGLLVLDEVQALLGASQRAAALLRLVRALAPPPRGRVLAISSTPLRYVEESAQLARLLRIVAHDRLGQLNLATRQLELLGLRECFDLCERLDPAFRVPPALAGGPYWRAPSTSNWTCAQALHYCLGGVIREHLFFAMHAPHERRCAPRRTYDLHWDAALPPEQAYALERGCAALGRAALQLSSGALRGNEALAQLRAALHAIEAAKVLLFAQLAEHWLRRHARCKVLLMVHASATLEALREALAPWAPLCVSSRRGGLAQRNRVRAQFQAADGAHRLLISTVGLLATGCDLDDQSAGGCEPRIMAISPSSLATDAQQQVAARVDRLCTSSQAAVFYVWSNVLAERELMQRLGQRAAAQALADALAQAPPTSLAWSQLRQWS